MFFCFFYGYCPHPENMDKSIFFLFFFIEPFPKETFKTSQRTDSQCHFSPILNARIYQCVKVIHLIIVLLFWILDPYIQRVSFNI